MNKLDAASTEEIWYKLNSIAYKLYHLNLDFKQLTTEELKFGKSLNKKAFLSGYQGAQFNHRTTLNTSIFDQQSTIGLSHHNSNSHQGKHINQIDNHEPLFKIRYPKSTQTRETSRIQKQTKRSSYTSGALRNIKGRF
jgi:hypothetical protein